MTANDDGNRLGAYLRARRGLVTPEQAGIPAGGTRRVPGLRREELAMLAGISADYYLRLERGRDNHPSPRLRPGRNRPALVAAGPGGAGVPPGLAGRRVRVRRRLAGLGRHRCRQPEVRGARRRTVAHQRAVPHYADAGSESAEKLSLLASLVEPGPSGG